MLESGDICQGRDIVAIGGLGKYILKSGTKSYKTNL